MANPGPPLTHDDTEHADRFRAAQLDTCAELGALKYHPRRFEHEIAIRTGPQAVTWTGDLILRAEEASAGFRRMLELDRPHQTIEYMVLRPEWRDLFADRPGVLETADWRLRMHGVLPPDQPPAEQHCNHDPAAQTEILVDLCECGAIHHEGVEYRPAGGGS